MNAISIFASLFLLGSQLYVVPQNYTTQAGVIRFWSDAPLEFIEARSESLRGILVPAQNEFAFSVKIESFQGFNSPLQREHFNENYLESNIYPDATFAGKIIETIDFSTPGKHVVRAKGKFTVHGVSRERIIRSTLEVDDSGNLRIESAFTVLLEEHQIRVPKMISKKIAEEIQVEVNLTLVPSP